MKKILYIINNLNCGGAEKALVSQLETIDYSKYEVDLFLFKHEGIFMSNIPNNVNLLSEPQYYRYFDMSIKKAIFKLLAQGRFSIAWHRFLFGKIIRQEISPSIVEQESWKQLSKVFSEIDTEYDVSIGFLEKNPIYFCVDKVKAKKRIGFIHNDYEKLGMNSSIDNYYFAKLDYIVTVSEECLNILNKVFPEYKNKSKVIHNIVSSNTIKRLASDKLSTIVLDKNDINIISVGRLNYQKGFELSIEACAILTKRGYNIKWNVLGEGEEREKLQQLINKLGINFNLLGIKENPYPFIKNSDIYVQSSIFEGKSIAIDEAKILNKPIVVTNFSTARDQIENEVNGLICDMNSESLANSIEKLIIVKGLKNRLINNLAKEVLGNEDEINLLYQLMES